MKIEKHLFLATDPSGNEYWLTRVRSNVFNIFYLKGDDVGFIHQFEIGENGKIYNLGIYKGLEDYEWYIDTILMRYFKKMYSCFAVYPQESKLWDQIKNVSTRKGYIIDIDHSNNLRYLYNIELIGDLGDDVDFFSYEPINKDEIYTFFEMLEMNEMNTHENEANYESFEIYYKGEEVTLLQSQGMCFCFTNKNFTKYSSLQFDCVNFLFWVKFNNKKINKFGGNKCL